MEPALGPVIFEYGYAEARREGVIAEFAMHNYKFPLSARGDPEIRGADIADNQAGRRPPSASQRPLLGQTEAACALDN